MGGSAAGRTVVLSLLVPITVLQIMLVHVDHAVPPRCINLLDLGTKYGECDELLSSGEFTCDHDFCPTCSIANEGFQAHQCDLSCGFCPEQVLPCPAPEEEGGLCINRLDLRMDDEGQCETLISSGVASCENDFCSDCEGTTGIHQGNGEGGHQHGECDRACGLCTVDSASNSNCSEAAVYYPKDSLPAGYLWETPFSSEMLADSIVILTNVVAATMILTSAKSDLLQRQIDPEEEEAITYLLPGHGACIAYLLLSAAATVVLIVVVSEIADTWVALYAMSVALSLLWSLKNPFPRRSYYAVGLMCPSLQLGLVLVFVGFDYSFGLFLLAASFYLAFYVVAGTTSQWVSAMFFAMQIVFADGLLFWSALFGLQWSLPAQLVGDRSRFIGAKMLLFMMGAPVVLMLVASTHAISHRRVAIGPLDAFLVLGLSLAPMLMWGLKMTIDLNRKHREVPVELDEVADDTDDEEQPQTSKRRQRGPPGR